MGEKLIFLSEFQLKLMIKDFDKAIHNIRGCSLIMWWSGAMSVSGTAFCCVLMFLLQEPMKSDSKLASFLPKIFFGASIGHLNLLFLV